MHIKTLKDLKSVFREMKTPVIGVGVNAFNRLGPQEFIPDYRIACLTYTKDTELIKKDIRVISLEKLLGKGGMRKNALTILRDKNIVEKFNSLPRKPALVIYKVSKNILDICRANSWLIIGQPGLQQKIEDKIFFRGLLEKSGIHPIPGEVIKPSEINYGRLSEKYGPKLVLQLPDSSGGRGTFFINSREEMEAIVKRIMEESGDSEIVVTKFITGPSPSFTACITRHGTFCTNLQHQFLDIPECINLGVGSGVFCGNDWTSSGDIPSHINKKAIGYAMKIGRTLKTMGYRGMFGLDLILEDSNIHVVECNPRLLGTFPTLTMVQLAESELPIMALHILESLGADYTISREKVNSTIQGRKRGSHIILFNKFSRRGINRGEIRPGIYELSHGRLLFRRPSYDLRDLKTEEEFLLTDGVPFRNRVFKPHERILRIMSLHRTMDKKTLKLNAWARERVNAVYRALRMEEC